MIGLAAALGLEPRIAVSTTLTDLESAVFPLDYAAINIILSNGFVG